MIGGLVIARVASRFRDEVILLTLVAVVLMVAISLGLAYPSPTQDTVCRYAMMAEKFSQGAWFESFHPRFGVLFPTLTGVCVKLMGVDGFSACVIVAMTGWTLALIPLFRLGRNVFNAPVAWFAVILYVICPQTIFWGFQGLRETWRILAMLLVVSALFESRDRCNNVAFWELFAGLGVLLTLRVDTVAYGLLAWVAYAIYDSCHRRFAVMTIWCVICLQPGCFLTWYWTGWWMPSMQLAGLLQKYVLE